MFVYEYPNYQILLAETPKEEKDLLQFGIPSDVWFQIENSAKSTPCYLRPSDPYSTLEDIQLSTIRECALAVKFKANLKRDPISLIYTFVSNLNSNGPINKHEVSQKIIKTKQETSPQATLKKVKLDLEAQRIEYERLTKSKNQKQFKQSRYVANETNKHYMEIAEQNRRGYSDLWDDDIKAESSNQNRGEDWEDDFM